MLFELTQLLLNRHEFRATQFFPGLKHGYMSKVKHLKNIYDFHFRQSPKNELSFSLWHPAILAIIGSLKARHLLINDYPMGAAPVAV